MGFDLLVPYVIASYVSQIYKTTMVYLTELHYRVITLSAQTGSKGLNGHVIIQGFLLYIFVVVLAIFFLEG